jgi:hypothetical protein
MPDELLANDVESGAQVSSPALAQVHVLTAVDVEAESQVSRPALEDPRRITILGARATLT